MAPHLETSTPLVLLAATTCIYLVLEYLLGVKQLPREPPLIPSKIPWFGHLIGIITEKAKYHGKVWSKHPLPIYSLPMPRGKMYVVNTPELITAVQRNPKTLQFAPFASKSHRSLFGTSREAEKIVLNNIDLADGAWGLWHDAITGVHASLAPGEGLDLMNHTMIENLTNTMDQLAAPKPRIHLYNWLRHELAYSTTEAVYGPKNPFRDPTVEQSFWHYEDNIMMVMANILPNMTARKAYNGRENTVHALKKYFQNNGHEEGSYLVKALRSATSKYGLSLDDTARFELSDVIAILVNTVPTAFWMLYYIFSDMSLLEDLRHELDATLRTENDMKDTAWRSIDVNAVKDECPLFASVWQETLRYHANGSSTREVMQDTLLENRYLLKKGSVIQMPSLVVHNDTAVWGPTASQFDAKRFLSTEVKTKKDQKQHPSAFRAFGGGVTLCPGRHFAKTEILSLVAMMVMRFEVQPVGGGEWPHLPLNDSDMAAAIVQPGKDVEVEIEPRKGFENGTWIFLLNPIN